MEMPTHIVAVAGLVEDGSGNVLMVKTEHGGWVFPGGQVEVGENLIDAVIREVKEESGIDVSVSNMIGVYSNTSTHEGYNGVKHIPTKVMIDFICNLEGGELSTSDETSESCWMQKEKVLDMITSPAIGERYKTYLEFDNKIKYMEYKTKPTFDIKLERTI